MHSNKVAHSISEREGGLLNEKVCFRQANHDILPPWGWLLYNSPLKNSRHWLKNEATWVKKEYAIIGILYVCVSNANLFLHVQLLIMQGNCVRFRLFMPTQPPQTPQHRKNKKNKKQNTSSNKQQGTSKQINKHSTKEAKKKRGF